MLGSACGTGTEPAGTPGSETQIAVTPVPSSPGSTTPSPSEAAPEPAPDPDPIARFTCGPTPPFAAGLLAEPAGAEAASDPAAAALRGLIEQEAGNAPEGATSLFPTSGWWRIAWSNATAAYMARSEVGDAGFVSATFTVVDGTWQPSQWGECAPQAELPPGLGLATWRIDGGAPGPEARTINALVTELACASGQSSEGRVVAPEITYGPDFILVGFAVRGLDGAQTCQGNPSVAYTIALSEPVGDRRVYDAGQLPPRDATTCAPAEFDCDLP